MTHEKALEIATQFMDNMNPERWNGVGEPTPFFDERAYEEPIGKKIVIEIAFVGDNYGWNEEWGYETFVELVSDSGQSYGRYTSIHDVNNVNGIADAIEYLCEKYIKDGVVV